MAGPALARLRIELEADSASLEQGLKKASDAMRAAATAGAAVGGIIANVALRIADSFAAAVRSVVGGIQEVSAASRQLGIPVEALSRLRFAAESVGVGFDHLRDGMSKLAAKIGEAADDAGSEAARAFEAMGVAVQDADGKVRPLGDVFREVSERFRTYADDASRATLATAIFGDRAEEMTRIASMTAVELDRLSEASDRSGNTISRQAAQAVDALAQAGRDSATAMSGLATELINRVAPTLLTVIDYFRQAYNNSSLLKAAIEVLAGAFRALVEILISADGVLREVGNLFSGIFNAVSALIRGDLTGAGAALSEMWANVGKAWSEATKSLEALHTGLTTLWQTTVQAAPGMDLAPRFLSTAEAAKAAAERIKQFREEMQNALSDPAVTLTDKLAAIQVALQEGAITFERYQRAVRQAYEMNAKAMEGTLQTVSQALTALFNKSKPAAIAAALINTYVGITQALRSLPPPWSFIQAAAVGAMGFAQVRNIQSTSSSGGGAPSVSTPSTGDGGGGSPSQMLTVEGLSGDGLMSMMSVRGLIERINEATSNGATLVLR